MASFPETRFSGEEVIAAIFADEDSENDDFEDSESESVEESEIGKSNDNQETIPAAAPVKRCCTRGGIHANANVTF